MQICYNECMGKIDEVKEELNYLKVWLGIVVVTTISLVGWLINHYENTSMAKAIGDIVAIVFLTVITVFIDRSIKKKIRSLRDLQ